MFARVSVPAPLLPLGTLLDYKIPEGMPVQAGSLVEVPFGRRKTWGLVFEISETCTFDITKVKEISSLKLDAPLFEPKRLEFLKWLSEYYFYPIGEVCETAIASPIREGSPKQLQIKENALKPGKALSARVAKVLNSFQQAAVDQIFKSSRAELLWGITGSGKTEVYLECIARVREKGKSALVLVPEISLTPQLTKRFEERFPSDVAIFHSNQKPTELRNYWLQTHAGLRNIAIGARSALFAPIKNLGIIILDEEHDSSYKQEERLRYHARDAALKLGKLLNIPVVLGSATPSAESLYGVRTGHMGLSKLPDRAVGEARLPAIHLVDLKKSVTEKNLDPEAAASFEANLDLPSVRGEFFLSPELRLALEETLANKKQAILFLNRRGLGSQILCKDCGHTFGCPSCDVKLTPHRDRLVCHYCAFEQRIPEICPDCEAQGENFIQVGVGTAAIEEAVNFHFPKARTLRLDRDSTEKRGSLEEIVNSFSQKEADILIGTQMVAKGHDFPDVTLVGVLLGEMGLFVPDYRANERIFQLLLQVSGRAGRDLHPGKVFIQSFQPEHPLFQTIANFKKLEDYGDFIEGEIEKRRALNYPPAAQMVLLRFDGLDTREVYAAAQSVGAALKKIGSDKLQCLGPVASPLSKLRNRYRYQILLKSLHNTTIEKALNWILEGWDKQKLEKKFKTRLVVDRDPQHMM